MKKHYLISLVILVFSALFVPSVSYAENETNEEDKVQIAEQDLMFQGIQGLVGSTANLIVGGDTPNEPDHIIAEIMYVLNFGFLGFAVLFMIVRGVVWFVQLGSDKKSDALLDFQSAPLAVMMAVLLLVPMPNGYSVIQHVVIYVAGESISLANKETNVVADFLDRTGSFAMNPTVMNSDLIALEMMESSVCMSMLNKTSKKTVVQRTPVLEMDLDDDVHSFLMSYDGVYTKSEAAKQFLQDIASNGSNGIAKHFPNKICGTASISFGSIDTKYLEQEPILVFRENVIDAYTKLNDDIALLGANFVEHLLEPVGYNGPMLVYNEAYPEEMKDMLRSHSDAFKQAYMQELRILVQKMNEASDNPESGLANKNATESLRQYGVAYLGAYFWEFARRNTVVTAMTTVNKSSKPPMYDFAVNKTEADAYEKIYLNQREFISEVRADYVSQSPDYSNVDPVASAANIEQDVIKSLEEAEHSLDFGADFMFRFATESMYEESDPILALADTGHQFIIVGEQIILSAAAIIGANRLLEAAAIGGAEAVASNPFTAAAAIPLRVGAEMFNITMDLAKNLIPFGFVLIAFGVLICFWIPSIPLFHWINGIIGFMIVFMQAFVLTPLIGLAHLLSGEKGFLSSKTQHGYMAIIQLFTYLPLMVVSFFVAYLVTMFGLKFAQIIYLPFMTMLNGDHIAGLLTGIFLIAIFIILNIQIVNRGFALITTMVEKAGKFIGGGEEMLGDTGSIDKAKAGFVAVSNSTKAGGSELVKSTAGKAQPGATQASGGNQEKGGGRGAMLAKSINNKTK